MRHDIGLKSSPKSLLKAKFAPLSIPSLQAQVLMRCLSLTYRLLSSTPSSHVCIRIFGGMFPTFNSVLSYEYLTAAGNNLSSSSLNSS